MISGAVKWYLPCGFTELGLKNLVWVVSGSQPLFQEGLAV
jgi:hypothetical protein